MPRKGTASAVPQAAEKLVEKSNSQGLVTGHDFLKPGETPGEKPTLDAL
jgi:hypothetical protein